MEDLEETAPLAMVQLGEGGHVQQALRRRLLEERREGGRGVGHGRDVGLRWSLFLAPLLLHVAVILFLLPFLFFFFRRRRWRWCGSAGEDGEEGCCCWVIRWRVSG